MNCSRLFLSLSISLLIGCTGNKASKSLLDNDTEPSEESVEPQNVIKSLPDTIYESALKVKYKVDTFVKENDPKITDLHDWYMDTPGAFTFRKGMQRQANFGGKVKGHPSEIQVDWKFKTKFRNVWGGGTGWTGQPLYVKWPNEQLNHFKSQSLVKADFSGEEVMIGSLCGLVYFIDFETGTESRDTIAVQNPIKGTMSLDPSLNGNLYVGQGVPEHRPFGALVIDLNKNKITDFFEEDPNAWRGWGAYDSSPLRLGDYLFRPGENGTLYKFYISPGKLTLQSTLRYKINGSAPGIESSMSIYHNYGYISDNHGNILCVNLDTMNPVWTYALGDDIDSSIVLIEEDAKPYIYTGCEIDRQIIGEAHYIKLDGLTGQRVWEMNISGQQYINPQEKHFDGGFYSSALPGVGDCDSLMFVNCVLNTDNQNGEFLAINRYTGVTQYSIPLKYYAWSSPVGFVNEKDEMFIVTGDCRGNIYLIDGKEGYIIYKEKIGENFESSPVVIENHLVVGSRGMYIYKMSVI